MSSLWQAIFKLLWIRMDSVEIWHSNIGGIGKLAKAKPNEVPQGDWSGREIQCSGAPFWHPTIHVQGAWVLADSAGWPSSKCRLPRTAVASSYPPCGIVRRHLPASEKKCAMLNMLSLEHPEPYIHNHTHIFTTCIVGLNNFKYMFMHERKHPADFAFFRFLWSK